jgi:8-oxo-dGTP diphosphatase
MALTEFTVAGGLVESESGLLLVRNRRRGGATDWSTPGGVIDESDPTLRDGLTREVTEETGLRVTQWEGPLYEVRAVAVEMGWSMRCEVHRALAFDGDLVIDDPDGIVVEARFAPIDDCHEFLALGSPWVREPLVDWLEHRWGPLDARAYVYDVRGATRDALRAVRVDAP